MRCIGARLRCACATICTICASTVCEPTFSERMTSAPLVFMVAPMSLSPDALGDRHRLAGQHRFVDRAAALDHGAVDRHFLARAHAQRVADVHVGQGHVFFAPIGVDASRGLGRQAEQRLDRRRGLRARLELEDLAEQRQRDDHRGRFEIDRDASHRDERARKRAGGDRRHDAVREGRPRPQPDQGPHVGAAVDHGLDATDEEGPAGPQNDGRGQRQLDPAPGRRGEEIEPMADHGEQGHRDRERQRPPEAAPEVDQLRALAVFEARHLRLERHAALRARAGMVLTDLGVHGAGVDRSRRRFGGPDRRRTCLHPIQVLRWVRDELGLAAGAAEVHGSAAMHLRMR